MSNARAVTSNQLVPHVQLLELLQKHLNSPYQAPIAAHNRDAFALASAFIAQAQRPLVLDSGCGTGFSTLRLAELHQNSWVIGVDRSLDRLTRQDKPNLPENCLLVRADLVDFWRLATADEWRLQHHYLLYPNPWPKKTHLKRRWHGHPVFPSILALQGVVELRTNWAIYAEEFALAMDYFGQQSQLQTLTIKQPLPPFEKKYHARQHALYQCVVNLA